MALVVTYTNGNLLFTDTGTQLITNTIALSPNDVIENRADGSVIIYADAKCSVVKAKFNRYTELSPAIVAPDLFVYKALPLPVTNIPSATEVASATWGYDDTGVLFYVKQMSDGSVVYESPIGVSTTPSGTIESLRSVTTNSLFVIIETSGAGSISPCIEWNIENTGGAAGTINGVNLSHQHESKGQKAFFYTPTGTYYLTDNIAYDATGTTFLITYTITS